MGIKLSKRDKPTPLVKERPTKSFEKIFTKESVKNSVFFVSDLLNA
jgi:hypothetical protein